MEQRLYELYKQKVKLNWILCISLLGILFLGTTDMLLVIRFIDDIFTMTVDGKIIKYIVSVVFCTLSCYGIIGEMNKSMKKGKKIDKEIADIEDDKKKKETMEDIKMKFESLSIDKQLQLLQFVKNDEIIKKVIPQIVSLDSVNQEKIQMELDSIYYSRVDGDAYLKYVLKEIKCKFSEIAEHMVIAIMEDIKRDRTLLKVYFSYIDWSKVSFDTVYERLFSEIQDTKENVCVSMKRMNKKQKNNNNF